MRLPGNRDIFVQNTVLKIQPAHALLPSIIAFLALSACGGNSSDAPVQPPPPTTALSLFAGSTDGLGNQDGTATAARLGRLVRGLAVSPAGDVVIADTSNNAIRKLSTTGQVSTLAGGGVTPFDISSALTTNHADGTGPTAKFSAPEAVAVDALGNTYVADTVNNVVRKIDTAGTTTTLAGQPGVSGNTDGSGQAATFYRPSSIAVDRAGNVYVTEWLHAGGGNPIRKITPSGVVSTVTTKASQVPSRTHFSGGQYIYYYLPVRVAVDTTGTIYTADPNDHVVRKFNPDGTSTVLSGTVTEDIVGYADGAASVAKFGSMDAIALDHQGRLFVLDGNGSNKRIRQIGVDGSVSTVVQSPACSTYSTPGHGLCAATDLAVDTAGNLIVNETGFTKTSPLSGPYTLIRKYAPNDATPTVMAGMLSGVGLQDGMGTAARFSHPVGLAMGKTGTLYIADSENHVIRAVSPDGTARTLGTPGKPFPLGFAGRVNDVSFPFVSLLATDSTENLYVPMGARIAKITAAGDVAFMADLNALVNLPTASSSFISGITVDSAGNVYAAAESSGAIFKINPKGDVTVFAGSLRNTGHADGPGSVARFGYLGSMATDAADNLYVIDAGNYHDQNVGPTIRKITPAGVVTTLAGRADTAPALVDGPRTVAQLTVAEPNRWPTAHLAVDAKGNVYVTDPFNSVVRKIAVADGQVSTLAGQQGRYGFAAGELPGMLNRPMGAVVRDSTLYVSMAHAVVQIKLP